MAENELNQVGELRAPVEPLAIYAIRGPVSDPLTYFNGFFMGGNSKSPPEPYMRISLARKNKSFLLIASRSSSGSIGSMLLPDGFASLFRARVSSVSF